MQQHQLVYPMLIPRLQLFEIGDHSWCPEVVRRGLTDYLAEITLRTHPYAPALPLLRSLLRHHAKCQGVLDLCSGSGGPWPRLLADLTRAGIRLQLELSDRVPNLDALNRFPPGASVRYRPVPLPATECSAADRAIRTLFSGFHHFRPAEAQHILAEAAAAGVPIAVFEATHRSAKAVIAMLAVPIAVLLVTPLMRPVRWWRLLLTYLLPVIPLAAWWDGLVSCLRTYRPTELATMTAALDEASFEWQMGELQNQGAALPVTYLIGTPAPGPVAA